MPKKKKALQTKRITKRTGVKQRSAAGSRRRAEPAGRKGGQRGRPKTANGVGGLLVNLTSSHGCGAVLAVAERAGSEWDRAAQACEVRLEGVQSGRGRERKGRKRRGVSVAQASRRLVKVCQAMAALGHLQRAKLVAKLLEGPATYQALRTETGLKAGPLYHHITQLRLAGLILPKQRDLYELTRGGRNLILTALAVGPLIRDRRRRPVGVPGGS